MTSVQKKWYDSRPSKIKKMIDKCHMNGIYKIKGLAGDDYYTIVSYSEDGTVKVDRWSAIGNRVIWRVFGVNPEDLIPLPKERYKEIEAIICLKEVKE